jgi:hypothetical protein
MKKIIAILTLLSACCSTPAVERIITESWDISRTPLVPMNMWFLQAESVQFNLTCTLGTAAYPLTNDNLIIVWELSKGEDYTNTLAVGTGTVLSATGGVVRLTLTPEQSNLTNGTYNGYVVAAVSDGTNITDRLVLARQKIVIGWSPYGLEYEYAGMEAPYYTRGVIDGFLAPLYAFTNAQFSANTNFEFRIAALEALPEIPTNAVTSIVLNGLTNSPTDGIVDLGTIEPGGGSETITNLVIASPGNAVITEEVENVITLKGFGTEYDGTYTNMSAESEWSDDYYNGTHLLGAGTYEGEYRWNFYNVSDSVYFIAGSSPATNPWEVVSWEFIDTGVSVSISSGNMVVSGYSDSGINGTYTNSNGLADKLVVWGNGYGTIEFANDRWKISDTNSIVLWSQIDAYNEYDEPRDVTLWSTNTSTSAAVYPYVITANLTELGATVPQLAADLQTLDTSFGSISNRVELLEEKTNVWNGVTNSLQWVSMPIDSVSSGNSGQYSISSDTNRFFYWYSPTAVSGSTTGIWLRVEGSTF